MTAMRLALALAVCGPQLAATAASNDQAPSFSSASLVNAATGQAVLAPYSICSIYGTDLFLNGSAAASDSSEVPKTLGGVSVKIGGVYTGLFYLSANQINLLIPNSLTPGTYSITVVRDNLASDPVPIVVQEVAPGLFASAPGFAAAFHADATPITANAPALPGEVVVLYGTGFGRTQRHDPVDRSIASIADPIVHIADFQLLFDGMAIDPSLVQFVGVTPDNAGLYQVNVRLPDNLPATNPEVQVSVAGVLSPGGLRLITSPPADSALL